MVSLKEKRKLNEAIVLFIVLNIYNKCPLVRMLKTLKLLKFLNTRRSEYGKPLFQIDVMKHLFHKNIKYIISVKLTYSNIIINLTDNNGLSKVITSSGILYFKGKLKTSRYAATSVTEDFLKKSSEYFKEHYKKTNITNKHKHQNFLTSVHWTGIKKNRKTILRLIKKQFDVKLFKNDTIQPHNGCRSKKKKRK